MSNILKFIHRRRTPESWASRRARILAASSQNRLQDHRPDTKLCPEGEHRFEQIRKGVQWCRVCNLWQLDTKGNVVTFPVSDRGWKPLFSDSDTAS